MNTTWTDVQDWLDIIDHLWIGVVIIAAAYRIQSRLERKKYAVVRHYIL